MNKEQVKDFLDEMIDTAPIYYTTDNAHIVLTKSITKYIWENLTYLGIKCYNEVYTYRGFIIKQLNR